MLYNLMDWSAFTGYIVLVRPTAALQRSVSSMRGTRMRAMNEAIQNIKFIKFSAWESRWIQRVLDARGAELGWLRKLKFVNFFMGMVWDLVPIAEPAVVFRCLTVVAKRELTVDIAFPCVTVFGMLSQSLTIVSYLRPSPLITLVAFDHRFVRLSSSPPNLPLTFHFHLISGRSAH
jgi:hypothetical protein